MYSTKLSRPTVGVLAGAQVFYGTILGNFIGLVLQGAHSAALATAPPEKVEKKTKPAADEPAN